MSVPVLDFFALPHGRPVAFDSAMVSVHEGRGFNAYFPMPFRRRMRMELTNSSPRRLQLYYQVDFTLLEELPTDAGFLHVSFRRENPTTEGEDFVITRGLKGPGRFLGCAVGVRVLDRGPGMIWYGEGEVKVFRDGDTHPTICGTGLEDYVGTAWGMGPYHAHWAGAPLEVRAPDAAFLPDFVGFYRWHVPDPIVFLDELTVTIQQIGYALFTVGQEEEFEALPRPAAGGGWQRDQPPGVIARGICERVDDYCAAAFVYCREPQAVPRVDVEAAREDVERRDFEVPSPYEALLALDAQE